MSIDASPQHGYGTLEEARTVLRATFGYPDFRPPQIRAVEAVLSGRDALLVLPTGGGKSLCYQVPALVRGGLTIVVSPLISLMKDQVETLARRGVEAAYINSTLSTFEVADRMARARDGSLRLLYLAPERLIGRRTLEQLAAIGVSLLAVDEAHCISEWGHDFRPSYRRIGAIRERLHHPQTVALTATATPGVRQDVMQQLRLQRPIVVIAGFDRANLTYHVVETRTPRDKDFAAVHRVREASGPCVVYAPTRKAVERVTALLVRGRIRATAYHGGLDPALRQRAQDAFMEDRARVIVATSAFGMGIDKPDVRLVLHHAMPGTLEAYYQEAGRAGRDGQRSSCVLLYMAGDRATHEFFLSNANPERAVIEQTWRLLVRTGGPDSMPPLSPEALAQQLPSSVGVHRVHAALRVLIAAGLCEVEPPASGRVWMRLLASPARIRRELHGSRAPERAMLRACWRSVGARLEQGAVVDLSTLAVGQGGAATLVPLLQRLEAQQFVTWTRSGGGVRLGTAAGDARKLPIDWGALERHRLADVARLNAMQRYARTHHCRRAFVLSYFGDPDARPDCGACDRCLGLGRSVVSV